MPVLNLYYTCTIPVLYLYYTFTRFPHGTSKRTELRSALNFEVHGTSKRTELQNARNFENVFETVFETIMYLIIPEPIL